MGKTDDWRSYLLGGFVCVQLTFLPVANLIRMFPARGLIQEDGELRDDVLQIRLEADAMPFEPFQTVIDALAVGCVRYAELTGQVQFWCLFAPDHPHRASLPLVELRWNDGKAVSIKSPFEPNDPNQFFKWPSTQCRLFNYEARMVLSHWRQPATERSDVLSKATLEYVRNLNNSMLAYMKWRTKTYLADHPKTTIPDEVILFSSNIPSREPTFGERDEPYRWQMARWLPGTKPTDGVLPVEAWDFVQRRFVPVKRVGSP